MLGWRWSGLSEQSRYQGTHKIKITSTQRMKMVWQWRKVWQVSPESPVCRRLHFPQVTAWALIIHTSQGDTFNQIVYTSNSWLILLWVKWLLNTESSDYLMRLVATVIGTCIKGWLLKLNPFYLVWYVPLLSILNIYWCRTWWKNAHTIFLSLIEMTKWHYNKKIKRKCLTKSNRHETLLVISVLNYIQISFRYRLIISTTFGEIVTNMKV